MLGHGHFGGAAEPPHQNVLIDVATAIQSGARFHLAQVNRSIDLVFIANKLVLLSFSEPRLIPFSKN
jgi:hypothetical protein